VRKNIRPVVIIEEGCCSNFSLPLISDVGDLKYKIATKTMINQKGDWGTCPVVLKHWEGPCCVADPTS